MAIKRARKWITDVTDGQARHAMFRLLGDQSEFGLTLFVAIGMHVRGAFA